MYIMDISIAYLEDLMNHFKECGGDALRIEVYEDSDEIPASFCIDCLLRPNTMIEKAQGVTIFPIDKV